MNPMINKNFPAQKKSIFEKNEDWKKKCMDSAINLTLFNYDSRLRESKKNVIANYNLWNGIVDEQDIERTINPYGINYKGFPSKMNHYPIINNKIQVLIGEETKRSFNFTIKVVNEDAITKKEEDIKSTIINSLMELSLNENSTEEEIKAETKRLERWRKYEAKDIRERIGTQLVKYYEYEQKLKQKFNEGFKDWCIAGEEIYNVDIIGGKLVVRRVNPLSIYVFGMGTSHFIEDADIIVEDSFQPIGWIIDNYYDYLTPDQIDDLETGKNYNKGTSSGSILNYPEPMLGFLGLFSEETMNTGAQMPMYATSNYFDSDGNVREVRVTWRSRRKIGIIEYEDEYGYIQKDLVDESFKIDPDSGIKIKWLWINEWWSGVKIGPSLYIKMGPRDIQMRDIDNISMCRNGYVGTIYSTNTSRVKSLMDRAKPYSYMYDMLAYKLDKIISRYKGPQQEVDFAKMPAEWDDIEKWLYYAEEMGYLFTDSFRRKDGMYAGTFNTSGRQFNPENGNFIKDVREQMLFIKEELGEIIGITRQREGSIDNRETFGGAERAITQSSHSTEELFFIHDSTKLRVYELILETAKHMLANKTKTFQYIADSDLATVLFTVDGSMFKEANYGVVMSNSSDDTMLKESLKSLAQAGIQNGILNFSKYIDIYMSDDMASTRRKLEQYEEETMAQQQENEQNKLESNERIQQSINEDKEKERQLKLQLAKLKSDTDILIASMKNEGDNSENIPEDNSLEIIKLEADLEKISKELALKEAEFNESRRHAIVTEKQKDEELAIKRKVANKPRPTSK